MPKFLKLTIAQPYKHKATAYVYFALRLLVIPIIIRSIFRADFESLFLCVLTLILFFLPSVLTKRLKVDFPTVLEIIILLFIYSAEILGELNSFYVRIPHWDTMLHTLNGFLCAGIGFALVDLLNRDEHFSLKLAPGYVALVAFCFSMSIGVCWEFFEYSVDRYLGLDMQKDSIIREIHSVELDRTRSNKVITIKDIDDVIIVHSNGEYESLGLGGYLDVGLSDTMKDLFVNLIGAIVFSVFGYFYAKSQGKGIAGFFIPQVKQEEEAKGNE
ncbi:MAG: hypothetical protein K6G51_05125 [Sphaerochaetaceae bacterium]|nr:hypothetical protein [Sphaerochaetaceae bacterium]